MQHVRLLAFHIVTNLVDHPSFGRGHKHIVGKTKDRPYIFNSTHRAPLTRKNKKEKRGIPAPALTPSTKPFTPSLEFRSLEWKDE